MHPDLILLQQLAAASRVTTRLSSCTSTLICTSRLIAALQPPPGTRGIQLRPVAWLRLPGRDPCETGRALPRNWARIMRQGDSPAHDVLRPEKAALGASRRADRSPLLDSGRGEKQHPGASAPGCLHFGPSAARTAGEG